MHDQEFATISCKRWTMDLYNWRNIAKPYRYKMLVDVANYVARELLACEVAMLHAKVLNYARACFSSVDVFCSLKSLRRGDILKNYNVINASASN